MGDQPSVFLQQIARLFALRGHKRRPVRLNLACRSLHGMAQKPLLVFLINDMLRLKRRQHQRKGDN